MKRFRCKLQEHDLNVDMFLNDKHLESKSVAYFSIQKHVSIHLMLSYRCNIAIRVTSAPAHSAGIRVWLTK